MRRRPRPRARSPPRPGPPSRDAAGCNFRPSADSRNPWRGAALPTKTGTASGSGVAASQRRDLQPVTPRSRRHQRHRRHGAPRPPPAARPGRVLRRPHQVRPGGSSGAAEPPGLGGTWEKHPRCCCSGGLRAPLTALHREWLLLHQSKGEKVRNIPPILRMKGPRPTFPYTW